MAKALVIDIKKEVSLSGVSTAFLQKTGQGILKALGWKNALVSLLLVGDRKIQQFNRLYLGENRPTDVLAFSQIAGKRPVTASQVMKKQGRREPVFLGDIMISVPTARRQAREYGNRFRYELCFYFCHGILHLMGYDDHSVRGAAAMDKKQKTLLARLGLQPGMGK